MHAQILVTSICTPPPSGLEPVRLAVSQSFGLSASTAPLLQDIEFAYHFSRNQYHSTSILNALDQAAPNEWLKILALVDVDLFIPILTHVFGEAQLGGRAAMISTYRLGDGLPDAKAGSVYQKRVMKEALHELGHTF
ncbi:MAG: hypothetical protein ACOC9D_03235, partial [Thermodesulfobacteriota bacterium]